jgi:hypothetical protein
MEYDNRIKQFTVFTPFSAYDECTQFVGEYVYLTNELSNYRDLNYTKYEKLKSVSNCINLSFKFEGESTGFYKFMIPEKFIDLGKHYREMRLDDFEGNEPLDEWVTMRRKSDGRVYNLRFNGYHADDDLNTILCLGSYTFTTKQLFNEFELNVNGNWQPFGIED